jgi:pimeloyl-ACP methyl ester carboxylesterase
MRRILTTSFTSILLILFGLGCTTGPDNTTMSADGVQISFISQGVGEPAVVFIHGWSNSKSIWDGQVSQFSKKYQTVALDLAGFGESGDNRDEWTIGSFANDVTAVIDKLNLKQVVLVGFSMGAPVAIETANKVPDRILGVVIVDDLHNIEMKVPPQMVAYIDSVFMDLVTNPTIEKMVGGGFVKKNPEESFKRVVSMLNSASKTGWRESLNNTLRWNNESCIESVKKVSVPVTAINSDLQPTNVEAFKAYVPSFQTKIIPGTGHVVMWDAPEEFNRLLEESIEEFMSKRGPE